MRISLNWIKDFLDIKLDDEKLKELISLNITEVEQMYKMVNATNLEVGYVKECKDHPDSDHLHICLVELSDGVKQIICGAPNVKSNIKVIVAKVDAILPGGIKIKNTKIRGIESFGMICSLQELGIEEKYIPQEFINGIYILDEKAKVGDSPLKYLHLDDTIIELGLTPNRGDLLSHLGFAYDLAAALNEEIKLKEIKLDESLKNDVIVKVESELVTAYHARKIIDVTIKESPFWLKARLMASGVRPINNIVDITNYVMLELGQPLHAFDADKIGNQIIVRNANKNEKTITLDEIERTLNPNDIVITNGKQIIALGGVMGGLDSSISNKTTKIILESANFEPISIRKTASRLNLHSESSMRFERKVDPNRVIMALDLAAKMISDLGKGKILKGISSYDISIKKDKMINLTGTLINQYLGTKISKEELISIFHRLHFKVVNEMDNYTVIVPTRRVDIEHYQDIIEEVGRIYGYNLIPETLPLLNTLGGLTKNQKWLRNIRHYLANMGINEIVSYSLINAKDFNQFTLSNNPLSLLLPMSEDKMTLRGSLLNGLISSIAYNKARQINDLALFEIGKIYGKNHEELHLSIGISGLFSSSIWQGKKNQADFYLLKGIVESLLNYMGILATYQKTINPGLHDGQTAKIMIKNQEVGIIGTTHPNLSKAYGIDKTYLLEINLDFLFSLLDTKKNYQPLCKYPSITRDLAIVLDRNVLASSVVDVIKKTAKKRLVDISIFDLYQGEKLSDDKKSLALSLVFQDDDKTLLSEDIDKMVNSILICLEHDLKAKLRT